MSATAAYLQKHWKTILALVAAGLLLLGVGIIAGYSIGRQSSNRSNTAVGSYNSDSSSSSTSSIGRSSREAPGVVRGAAILAEGQSLQQLPPPESDEAKQLISQPGTPGNILAIYTYDNDAVLITERLSAAFLQQLKQQTAPNYRP